MVRRPGDIILPFDAPRRTVIDLRHSRTVPLEPNYNSQFYRKDGIREGATLHAPESHTSPTDIMREVRWTTMRAETLKSRGRGIRVADGYSPGFENSVTDTLLHLIGKANRIEIRKWGVNHFLVKFEPAGLGWAGGDSCGPDNPEGPGFSSLIPLYLTTMPGGDYLTIILENSSEPVTSIERDRPWGYRQLIQTSLFSRCPACSPRAYSSDFPLSVDKVADELSNISHTYFHSYGIRWSSHKFLA